MKKLQLGQYNRSGELAGSADIAIDNFALGTVNDTTGAINPFLISNPYIEFAYDGSKMVGIRIGFGEAKGYLSGDIKTLTGNVPVDLYGTGSQLGGSISCGLLALDCLAAKTAITLTGSSQYTAQAELVNSSGNPDPIRAAMIGLKNGTALDMHDSTIIGSLVNVLLPFLTSNDCKLMGAQTCFQPGPVPVVPDRHRGSEQRAELHRLVERLLHLDAEPERPVARPAGSLQAGRRAGRCLPQHVAQRRWNGADQGRLRSGLQWHSTAGHLPGRPEQGLLR